MAVVVVSPTNVVTYPEGGGHFWVYMQYVQGLRQIGCEVYWLERFRSSGNPEWDDWARSIFFKRMERFGLSGRAILYTELESAPGGQAYQYLGIPHAEVEALLRRADLLLNFHYAISPALLATFRTTALVDIDPGLLQFWMHTGQIAVPSHDYYFTIGETVGTPAALFPDCGLSWIHISPPVCLDLWPYSHDSSCEAFTTVSSWWGDEFIADGESVFYENNKRVTFLAFAELPRFTKQVLELALYLGEGDTEDRGIMEGHGWRIRHSVEVTETPEAYQSYIRSSRGEFSCVKPSCLQFQNAWVSDRTLCYLASGKPAVVQHTGASSFLPNGEGLFRFSTLDEAVEALAAINADYEKHCRAARGIAETYFDAEQTLERVLNSSLT